MSIFSKKGKQGPPGAIPADPEWARPEYGLETGIEFTPLPIPGQEEVINRLDRIIDLLEQMSDK